MHGKNASKSDVSLHSRGNFDSIKSNISRNQPRRHVNWTAIWNASPLPSSHTDEPCSSKSIPATRGVSRIIKLGRKKGRHLCSGRAISCAIISGNNVVEWYYLVTIYIYIYIHVCTHTCVHRRVYTLDVARGGPSHPRGRSRRSAPFPNGDKHS